MNCAPLIINQCEMKWKWSDLQLARWFYSFSNILQISTRVWFCRSCGWRSMRAKQTPQKRYDLVSFIQYKHAYFFLLQYLFEFGAICTLPSFSFEFGFAFLFCTPHCLSDQTLLVGFLMCPTISGIPVVVKCAPISFCTRNRSTHECGAGFSFGSLRLPPSHQKLIPMRKSS